MNFVRKIQRIYYLTVFLFWLSVALTLPLMVLILQSRGMDLFQIGLLMGIYSLTIVLLEVPTGGLADAIGRKRVAMAAYLVILLSGLVVLFSFSFAGYLLAFVLSGVGRALSSGTLDAWFVDSLQAADPEIDIQPPLAKAGTVTLVALGLGTLLGGVVPRLLSGLPAEGTAVLTPFTATILFSGLLLVALLVVIAIFVEDSHPRASAPSWKAGFQQVPAIVKDAFIMSRRNGTIVLLLGVTMASGLALASIESFWSPHFAALIGGSEGRSLFFGALMAGSFLFGALGNISSIPLGRVFRKRYGLLAAVFQGSQGLFLVILAAQTAVGISMAAFWLLYMTMGVVNSPLATMFNDEIPSSRRSSMLSVQSLAAYAGSIMGSVLLGYLARSVSISAAWIVAGIVLLVSLLLYVQVDVRRSRNNGAVYDPEAVVS